MRPIPPKLRKYLETQKRMKRCVIADLQDVYGECSAKIEWEHLWIYGGPQVNEAWAIIGACKRHHDMKEGQPGIKAAFQIASLALASEEDLQKYPRKPWDQIKKSLNLLWKN